jgi:hypothetical protein
MAENTEIVKVENEFKSLTLERASAMQVTTQVEYTAAGEMLQVIVAGKKKVLALLDPQCKATYNAWQVALGQKKKYMDPIESVEKSLKSKMGDFELEQERLRKEAEEAALKEAEKAREKLLKKADKAREKGQDDLADHLEMVADGVGAEALAELPEAVQHDGGTYSQKDWDITVKNPMEFIKAIANGTVKVNIDSIITWKIGGIKAYVKASGSTKVPGLTILPKKRIQVGKSIDNGEDIL